MMPGDEFVTRPASAVVEVAAGGNVTTLAYEWEHPTDGRQAGLVAMWATDDTGSEIRAIWSDSWHQQPSAMELVGRVDDGGVALEGTYAETWGWRIAVESGDSDALRIVMCNVVPPEAAPEPSAAGPYEVAVTELAR
jgi:hypothetical protein